MRAARWRCCWRCLLPSQGVRSHVWPCQLRLLVRTVCLATAQQLAVLYLRQASIQAVTATGMPLKCGPEMKGWMAAWGRAGGRR